MACPKQTRLTLSQVGRNLVLHALHFHHSPAAGCAPRWLEELIKVPEVMAVDSSIPFHMAAHQELGRTSMEELSGYTYTSFRKDSSVLCCQKPFFSSSQWSKYFRSAMWLCGKDLSVPLMQALLEQTQSSFLEMVSVFNCCHFSEPED